MKVGVFLARLQPLHNGHMYVLKFAAQRNDVVHVFIGSETNMGQRETLSGALSVENCWNKPCW